MSGGDVMADHVTEQLTALLDGELVDLERARVEEHLKACASCAAERDSLAMAMKSIAALAAPIEPSADLRRAVLNAVDAEPLGLGARFKALLSVRFLLPAGAAAVAAVALAMVFAGRTPDRTTIEDLEVARHLEVPAGLRRGGDAAAGRRRARGRGRRGAPRRAGELTMKRTLFILLVASFALAALPGSARAGDPGPEGSTAPGRSRAGENAAERFKNLPEEKKEELRRKWREFRKLPPEEQQALREKVKRWRDLPPERKAQIIRNFEAFKALPPAERDSLEQRFEKWSQLSPEQRQALRREIRQIIRENRREKLEQNAQRWREMTPEERQQARQKRREMREQRRQERQERRERFDDGDGTEPPSKCGSKLRPTT
ncbi:MAG: DUF3106 domain-containing protein [Myxococcales bacterium]